MKRNICKIEYESMKPRGTEQTALENFTFNYRVVVDHSSSFESTLAIKYLLIPEYAFAETAFRDERLAYVDVCTAP